MVEKRQVLGDNVRPLNYKLEFDINFKAFKYSCTEEILVHIAKSTKEIRLNSQDLKIKSTSVKHGASVQKASVKAVEKLEQIVLHFDRAISGNATIMIESEGDNKPKLSGFYKSTYMVGKKEHHMLTTQFEPADARKAFPCFDEPGFKATFDVSFTLDGNLSALSNMPEKSVKKNGKKKTVTFRTSPKMSCYLLYFGVGEFERLSANYGKVKFSVVTVPGKIKLAGTALEYGMKFMKYYENYFNIKYPLPKMDFIAIPDFQAAGMENWGAITYSELALLTDRSATSVAARQRIGEVVAHELAHQWFGDLVTMEWWDDTWLNESFATFMSYKAIDSVYPEWKMGLQAILGRNSSALAADQLRSTQPIGMKVNSPSDLSDAFDSDITYNKGGSVLSMLEDYVGEEAFRKGLKEYLRKFAYSNATRHDLWDEIGKAAGRKESIRFDSMASYWINNPGFPMVDVKYSNGTLDLSQKRFLLLDRPDPSVWPVPMHYIKFLGGKGVEGRLLLDKKNIKIKEELESIKLNYLQKGFYRVKYPDDMLEKLGKLVKSKRLSGLEGWGIENDLYSMARSCRVSLDKYIDFIEKYCLDAEYPLSMSVSGHLNGLNLFFGSKSKQSKRLKEISLKYNLSLLKKLGWEKKANESTTTTLLRGTTIATLGFLNDKAVVNKAKKLFSDYIKSGKEIEPNIRVAVYVINAWTGNAQMYERFLKLYIKEEIPEEKLRFMRALGSFSDPKLVDKALKFAMSKDVRQQYIYVIPYIVSSHEYGKTIIWKWVQTNWKKLMSMFGRNAGGLEYFIEGLYILDDRKSRKEIELFFKKKGNMRDDMKRNLAKVLESIDINIKFKEFNS